MMWTKFIISIINGIANRIRGGLDIPFTNKNFPLNKWWFAVAFTLSACYLKGFSWNFFFVMLIASRLATQLCGWGEYKGCCLGAGKPDPKRHDMFEVDEFLDNFGWEAHDIKIWKWTIHIPAFKLIDYPILYGWLGLSIRGLYWTFIIGLALQSIPFMCCGLAWGTICYLCGLFSRKVYPLEKCGWNVDEIIFGMYLGFMLCVIC